MGGSLKMDKQKKSSIFIILILPYLIRVGGRGGGGGENLIPFLWIKCRFFWDPGNLKKLKVKRRANLRET